MSDDSKAQKAVHEAVHEEAHDEKLLIGHSYDGIQELDNSLPQWWLYGFYFTMVFAVVYMAYFEVFGTGPSMEQEYLREMSEAGYRVPPPEDVEEAGVIADPERLRREAALHTSLLDVGKLAQQARAAIAAALELPLQEHIPDNLRALTGRQPVSAGQVSAPARTQSADNADRRA